MPRHLRGECRLKLASYDLTPMPLAGIRRKYGATCAETGGACPKVATVLLTTTQSTQHVWYNRRTCHMEQTLCNLRQLWLDFRSALAHTSR